MMKRTRVDEVQFGTRPGPPAPGVVGVGVGVGVAGVGVGPTSGVSVGGGGSATVGVNTGVTIGTVVPSAHSATISGISSIHHRILTPQHGGAQTIAYLPSTTPTATNLKTTSSIVDSTSSSSSIISTSTGGAQVATVGVGVGTVGGTGAAGGVVVSTGSAGTQTLQYTTSYSVASIQAGGTLKGSTSVDGGNTVQIHVTGGAGAVGGIVGGSANPSNAQTVSSSSQTASSTIRQRTISGTQTAASAVSNLTSMAQHQTPGSLPQTAQTPTSASAAVQQPGNIVTGSSTPPQGQGSGGGNATPRLKVEDALSYLDQVKYQYADQPQIYNNFLDIMKEFKSHCIDTPGVIERVSTLFKGHTELIYGFNMFLPPGYKIEIHSDALGCSVPVVSMPSPPGAPTSTGTVHMIAGGTSSPLATAGHNLKTTLTVPAGGGAVAAGTAAAAAAVAQIQSAGAVNLMTHGGASLTQTTIHALQQATPPQSQSPGHVHVSVTSSPAPAVVAVTGGQPPGSISVSAHNMPQNYSRDRERATITPTAGQVVTATAAPSAASSIVVGGGPPTPNSLSELSPHGGAVAGGGAGAQHNLHHIQQAHQSILLGETGQQNQPVEFNHAITYVNKIKNRFQNQPAKYKKFLEILHAYQKEQKVMKEGSLNQGKMLTEQEVYTQVAKLFGQDEDLLREFGQFLPDATNHQSSGGGQYMAKASSVHLNDHSKQQQQRTTATLSGGAHITMSSASPAHSIGSPLHLSGGGTLPQTLDSSAHAAAIGNLSAVNTSVSIKTYNNNQHQQQQQQQNHVIASQRNDLLFEKDYHGVSPASLQQQQQQSHQRGAGVPHHHLAGTTAGAANIRAGAGGGTVMVPFEKEHRNNHHVQKYVGGHSQNQSLSHHGHNAKKSPSYGLSSVIGSLPHLSDNSLDRSSPGISYAATAVLTAGHHAGQNNSAAAAAAAARRQGGVEEGGLYGSVGGGSGGGGPPPAKRSKPFCRDVSFSEASSKCTIADAAFFDKVRKALRSPEVYENFLRCLTLFNQEIVSKAELLGLVSPFLMKFPDLLRWFTDFLGPPVGSGQGQGQVGATGGGGLIDGMPLASTQRQGGSSNSSSHDRDRERGTNHPTAAEYVQDVDLSACKRLGASYCALPQSSVPKKCSGRTALCREVLNDKWVSFPTWASEDSTFVTSRKTQFEETIYRNIHRTEDERFELDLVIEVNSATIQVLEGVQKKMSRMSSEELAKFHLDDTLGGTSQTIHQRAIHRIYGDKSGEIIQGMKKNPSVAVPIILKRLKVKEEEWRDAQKGFNKQWREQNEKYYLKSLDHQAINFKPNDMKALRSKSLFNEIETLYDERHDQEDDAMEQSGPHLVLPYKDKTILDDAANLLIHHVKRQTGIQKLEKQKIKQIIRQFVPDLFFAPRQPLSDDERDDDDNTKMDVDHLPMSRADSVTRNAKGSPSESGSPARSTASTSSSAAAAAAVNNEADEVKPATTAAASSSTTTTTTTTAKTTPASSASDDATPSTSSAAATAVAAATSASEVKAKDEPLSNRDEAGSRSTTTNSTGSGVSSPRPRQDQAATSALNPSEVEIKQEQQHADFAHPKLLPQHAQGQHEDESYSLFFASNNWYLFLRLHAILCDRLHHMYERARLLAIEEERCRVNRRESTATALRLKPKPEVQVEDYYPTFLDMLKNVLDGNMDSNTFEDTMREMFGIYAYVSFTLDKVVSNAVRQLQYCVTERAALDCVELYATEQRRGSTGGFCRDAHKIFEREMSYQRKAESMFNEENCFKVYIYKIDCRVTIELLDSEPEEADKPALKAQKFSKYVERVANPGLGGSGSGNSAALSSENIVEEADIKTEEEDENAEHARGGGAPKARFLLRNKRRSQLHEEQVRQLFDQKRSRIETTGAPATTNAAEAGSGVDATNSTSSSSGNTTTNNNNNNNNNNWGKRLPERLGAPQVGLAEQYAFNDRDEITTNSSNGRCFVTSKNLKLLKYDAVRRAKKSHCRVTQAKYVRYQAYVNNWLQQHVSEQLQQNCSDWLLGKTADQINASGWGATCKTKSLQQKDTSKTPYRVYTRYKVIQLGGNAASGSSIGGVMAAATTANAPVVATATSTSVSTVLGTAMSSNHPIAHSSILSTDSTTTTTSNAPQQHCNSAAAAAAATTNAAEALQQVRPMES